MQLRPCNPQLWAFKTPLCFLLIPEPLTTLPSNLEALFSLLTTTNTCWEVFRGFLFSSRLESTFSHSLHHLQPSKGPFWRHWKRNLCLSQRSRFFMPTWALMTLISTNSGGNVPLTLQPRFSLEIPQLSAPIGWKKELCPFCGAQREFMRHLFGTCSALALQPPPFQAFL